MSMDFPDRPRIWGAMHERNVIAELGLIAKIVDGKIVTRSSRDRCGLASPPFSVPSRHGWSEFCRRAKLLHLQAASEADRIHLRGPAGEIGDLLSIYLDYGAGRNGTTASACKLTALGWCLVQARRHFLVAPSRRAASDDIRGLFRISTTFPDSLLFLDLPPDGERVRT